MALNIPEITNAEIIEDFIYKTDPKSSAPRQKLSAVYHYMLNYHKESNNISYYVYTIPSFMDIKCGFYSVLKQLSQKINDILQNEQNEDEQETQLQISTFPFKHTTPLLYGGTTSLVLGGGLFILGTGPFSLLSLGGIPFVYLLYYLYYKKNNQSYSLKQLSSKVFKFIYNMVNSLNFDQLFTEDNNVIVIKIDPMKEETIFEVRSIPEIEEWAPNMNNLKEVHTHFYMRMWILFRDIIQKVNEKLKRDFNYIPNNEFQEIDQEFKSRIIELENEIDKRQEQEIENNFREQNEYGRED